MKVKEIEIRSGMDRSNIRFYEREGFINPERFENGYREYTEDDLNKLVWIKLLRSLQISLDEVKSLFSDEKSLLEVLKRQVSDLEEAKGDIHYAQQICEKIRQSGSHISELNPYEYLELLEKKEVVSKHDYFTVKKDRLPQVFLPWTRFFARSLDLALYVLLWGSIQVFYLHVPLVNKIIRGLILDVLMIVFFMIIFEPILIATTGTTIGKSVFGLKIKTFEMTKLSYGDALRRTYLVLVDGMGLLIPIYSMIRLFKSYKLCSDEEVLQWDEGLAYDLKDNNKLRYFAAGGVSILVLLLFILTFKAQVFPPHRGDLTLKEYTENFQYYQKLLGVDFSGYTLSDTGQWAEPSDKEPDLLIGYMESPMMLYSFNDGIVDTISFNINIQNKRQTLYTYDNHMLVSYLSMAGAQETIGLFSNKMEEVKTVVSKGASEGFSHIINNVSASAEVELVGYQNTSPQFVVPLDDAKEYIYKVNFSVKKND